MKMMYNGTQIKSLNVKHYEMNTNSCDMIASDLQAGKTAVARGKKITGTGKSFEFAYYGQLKTNDDRYIPSDINVIELSSLEYPVKLTIQLTDLKNCDFSTEQTIATVVIDGIEYDLVVAVNSNLLKVSCDKTFYLQVFFGKDNYV